jgi:hypothetical protein
MLLTLYSPRVGDTFACDRHETLPEPTPLPEKPEEMQIILYNCEEITIHKLYNLLRAQIQEGRGDWRVTYDNDYCFADVERVALDTCTKELTLQ